MTNNECLNMAEEYRRVKAELTEMTARCNEMRQEIIAYMTKAGRKRVVSENIVLVLTHRTRNQLDTKALKADYPEIVRGYEYETEYDELKIL